MEYAGAASKANRESLSFGSASTVLLEESDVIAQLFGNGLFSSETHHELNLETPSMYWPDYDGSFTHHSFSDVSSNDQYYRGEGVCASGTTSHFVQQNLEFEKHYLNDPNAVVLSNASFIPMETCMGDGKCDATELLLDEPAYFIVESTSNGSGESNVNPLELTSSHDRKPPPKRRLAVVEKEKSSRGSPQKKVHRNAKNAQSKRTQKNKKNCETEEENITISTCSSEDESCESQETNGHGGGVRSSSESRARRGSATDPQSLYARKRRERINERLKILQNLVPNGTKVDISTMLEEAVQYVKFLQLQIKLLSSDDLWMYAPIAYNGMNIGLDLKISPSQ